MEQKAVIVEYPQQQIARIILNRPNVLNAINGALLEGLVDALQQHSATHRVIILEGAGDRSFCAGEDLKQGLAPATNSATELREAFYKLQDITRFTSSSRAIVIAAVQGFAIGGGAEIALAADFVIGSPQTKFRFPEVPIGHAATGGITLRLSSMVGLLKAKELLLTGQWVDGQSALELGLLTELCEDPKKRALRLAAELAEMPGVALSSSKCSLERAVFPNLEACMQDEVNFASYCFAQGDASRAFTGFASRKDGAQKLSGPPILPTTENEPSKPLSTLPALDNTGARAKFRDINSALHHAVTTFPDRNFIRLGGRSVTFRQVDEAVGRLAGGLRASGIGPGDRCIVMMKNSIEMVYTWLAANRIGAIWVPINVQLRSVTLKHIIAAASPKLAVVDAEFRKEFLHYADGLQASQVFFKDGDGDSSLSMKGQPVTQQTEVAPDDAAAFLYTSGTTGRSKPCILAHEYFIHQGLAFVQAFNIRQDDVLYCPFPLSHADATALTVIPAILKGATAALAVKFSASRFWDDIRATQATVYDFMGATLAMIYKQPPTAQDKDHKIRFAWGVPMPSFAKKYEERFGHPLFTLYGSVESGLPITQQGPLASGPGSCGRARSHRQVRIANARGDELPANTPGQLLLRSNEPNAFFKGYFNDPTSTLSAFSNLWLHTGDLAKMDENGNIFFVGRIKDVIRRRGENINASEVEEEFLNHSDVIVAAAYGIPSQLGTGTEQDLKVALQLRPGSDIKEKELWDWSRQRFARFQVPDVIQIVPEIRTTTTGKLEKHGLAVEGGHRFSLLQPRL